MNATHESIDELLDASGLECPLPVMKAKARLARMTPGAVLRVIATDRHAPIDFQVYCMRSGDELVKLDEAGERIEILIRKAGTTAD